MSEIFGPIVTAPQIEDAILGTLEEWLPTYLTEVEQRAGLDAGTLARPRFYGSQVEPDLFPGEKLRYRIGPYTRLVLVPPLPGTPEGDRFSELRVGLDHVSLGVKSRAELERLVDVLRAAGVATQGIQYDALGPGVVCFRDPDNIAWEFFEQA